MKHSKSFSISIFLLALWLLSGCGGTPKPGTTSDLSYNTDPSSTSTEETSAPPPKPVIKKEAKELFAEAGRLASQRNPQYQRAIELYKNAHEEDSNLADALYNIGLIYERLNDEQQAIEWYQKAGAYRVLDGWVNIGLLYKKKGDLQQAAQFFEKAIDKERVHSRANLNLAKLYLNHPKVFPSSKDKNPRTFARNALKEDSSNADAYEILAQWYYSKKRYQLGLLVCNSGLQDLDSKHAGLFNVRALIYLKLDEVSLAIKSLSNALKYNPKHFGALLNLGILKYGYRDYQESYSLLSQAVQLQPKHIEAVLSKAVAARALKRFDEALAGYQEVLKLSPNHAGALFNIAVYHQDFQEVTDPKAKVEHLTKVVKEYENVLQYTRDPALRKKVTGRITELKERLEFMKEM